MKKRILSLALCGALLFCLASCKSDNSKAADAESNFIYTEPIASFDTVENFKIAMKKNPTQYMGNRVSVKGYINKLTLGGTYIHIWLEDVHTEKDELRDDSVAEIKVTIPDEILRTVVGDGDFVEICGTVVMEEGKICLDDCTYTMITTIEEKE